MHKHTNTCKNMHRHVTTCTNMHKHAPNPYSLYTVSCCECAFYKVKLLDFGVSTAIRHIEDIFTPPQNMKQKHCLESDKWHRFVTNIYVRISQPQCQQPPIWAVHKTSKLIGSVKFPKLQTCK
jgi:hypothetical protein